MSEENRLPSRKELETFYEQEVKRYHPYVENIHPELWSIELSYNKMITYDEIVSALKNTDKTVKEDYNNDNDT